MKSESIQLVRQSWDLIEASRVELARAFYRRLFELSPDTSRLFSQSDMSSQELKFAHMLNEIVRSLDQPYRLIPELTNLGRRHLAYGVKALDYAPVGDALLLAWQDSLGDQFTPQMHAAWREAYLMLAQVMVRSALLNTH
jgi:hemoglobin-like flavoprotein